MRSSSKRPSARELSQEQGAHEEGCPEARSSSPRREIELDFLRGLAILMVLDFHAPVHWLLYPFAQLGWPNFGWAGVDLFFVLSGFLVGGLLIKEWQQRGRIDSPKFLIRRGFKIWPQYYVFLGLMLVTHHRSLHELWGNLLNIQNYVGGIPHTWSLAVEEHAYLLLVGALALAARWRLRPWVLAVAMAVSAGMVVLTRLLLITHGHSVVTQTHTRIEGILYGVLLAMLYHYKPESWLRLQRYTYAWLGLCLGAVLFFRFQSASPWSTSLGWDAADALGVGLLMLLYRPRAAKRPAWYRLVAWIGVYSYGIYLWHVAVIAPTVAVSRHLPAMLVPAWLAVIPMLAGIGVGALCTRLIEFPALKVRDRLYPRQVGSPVARSAAPLPRNRMAELDASPHPAGA